MLTRIIKDQDEEYVVEVKEDDKLATVTDENGTAVTIRYSSGNLNVRLPNGWGGWKSDMKGAVAFAITLCRQAKLQLTPEAAYDAMVGYINDKC